MSITPNNPNIGGGGGGGPTVNPSVFGHLGSLPGIALVPVRGSNLATGNTDLYTVPSGKRAYVNYGVAFNGSGGSVTHYATIKVSGSYYPVSVPIVTANNSAPTSIAVGTGLGIVLEAGEILAINCATTAGLNANFDVYLFDDTANFKSAKNLALSNGANTLYICPTGKKASFNFTQLNSANGPAGVVYPALAVSNFSGGSLSYSLNCVPSGGTAGTGNLLLTPTAVSSPNVTSYGTGTNLTADDFLVVTTSSANAGQAAWVNVWEV